jgi:hypothetical protein
MLERSAGKLARSVLRGRGEREPTWLPGGTLLNGLGYHSGWMWILWFVYSAHTT